MTAVVPRVKIEFYVMSQCPYGVGALKNFKPVLDQMGESIDFSLDFIAVRNQDGTFSSMHGAGEVFGDIVQLCAARYYPAQHKYMDLVGCQGEEGRYKYPQGSWRDCALKTGLDPAVLEPSIAGDEGKALLAASTGKLPAYLFSESFLEDAAYEFLSKWLTPSGGYLVMTMGALFDPTKEICDNGVDDTGEGLVDCADDECKAEIKFLEYALCRATDVHDPDWKKCAKKAKLSVAKVGKCAEGKAGLKLLGAEAKLAADLAVNATPTFIGNNKVKLDGKDRTPEGIKKAVCDLNPGMKACAGGQK